MRLIRSLMLVGLVLVLAAPAGAAEEYQGIKPTFGTSDVYFHCNGETKVYNANWLAQAGAASAYVPWDANPPTQSVQQGAGCGALDAGWVTNEVYDAVFYGTFTGNLRDVTVELHELALGNLRTSATQQLRIYAEVDGVPVFPVGNTEGAYTGRTVTVTPVRSSTGASSKFEFSITNLGFANYIYDEEGVLIDVQRGGVALEDGDGTREHDLLLLVGVDSFPGGQPATGVDAWAWDTTEVPSGITFNPGTLAPATVAADLPNLT